MCKAETQTKMSFVRCPNYEICSRLLFIGSRYESNQIRDTIKICGIPVRDSDTNEFFLELSDELPVCWECRASYNEDNDDKKNIYLTFTESTECCICLKTGRGVSFPNCLHYTCIPCHNRCWFGPKRVEIEFPYCESIKKMYLSDPRNSIWQTDSKIKEYIEQNNKMEDERMEQWEHEKNLRKCPICRQ